MPDPSPALARLRRLLAESAARPWRICCADRDHACQTGIVWAAGGDTCILGADDDVQRRTPEGLAKDTRLIVSAVNALPSLLAIAEAAEELAFYRRLDMSTKLLNALAVLKP
jgi:hypothetical protein